MKQLVVIACTVPHDENIARTLAKSLITKKLAACVTLLPNAYSVYSWSNTIETQKEIQLFIKTHIALEQDVYNYIKTEHPYQTPELLTLKIANGELNYLSWIYDALNQKK